jgi:hypothetical protein
LFFCSFHFQHFDLFSLIFGLLHSKNLDSDHLLHSFLLPFSSIISLLSFWLHHTHSLLSLLIFRLHHITWYLDIAKFPLLTSQHIDRWSKLNEVKFSKEIAKS